MKKLLPLAATLLLASCSFFSEPTLEEFAARVPDYDDATPVNHYALKDYKTIGDVRRALHRGSLKANESSNGFWNNSYGTRWGTEEKYSQEEIATQRLALLDLMLRFGGDPQKVAPCGDAEERGIAYAMLIQRGLHADEPFTRMPESIEKYGYEDERYPLTQLALLPDSVMRWLVENGAPLNETFNGKTELMRLYDNLWGNVVAEEYAQSSTRLQERAEEAEEEWNKAYRVTEYLLSQGLDLSVKDEQGHCAIDHIPYVVKEGEELTGENVSSATLARAQKLAQLLLEHGSPARTAPATSGREYALMAYGLLTISWVDGALEDMAAARRERARQEHEEREARLAPLRAKRRAAEAEAGKLAPENAEIEPWRS